MVVVEGGKKYINVVIDTIVTSVLQTPAGRMILPNREEKCKIEKFIILDYEVILFVHSADRCCRNWRKNELNYSQAIFTGFRKPVLAYTIDAFEKSPLIDEIIVVINENHEKQFRNRFSIIFKPKRFYIMFLVGVPGKIRFMLD